MPKKKQPANRPRPRIGTVLAGSNGHPPGGLLSAQEAALYLKVSVYTLMKWTKLGLIDYVKPGHDYRYTLDGLNRFIARNTVIATEP